MHARGADQMCLFVLCLVVLAHDLDAITFYYSTDSCSLSHMQGSSTDVLLPATFLSCVCHAVLAHDLDTITFYDSKGEFVGVRRAGSGKPIKVSLLR